MNAHNEQQARKLLALGLDEFGHHTEAYNVRNGIDRDVYKAELWAIRAALDAQPAAAQEAVAPERVAWARNGATGSTIIPMPGLHKLPHGDYDLFAAPVTAAPAMLNLANGVQLPLVADEAGYRIDPAYAQESTPAAPGIDLRSQMLRLAEKWEKQAAEHGVRQFTGNDHLLFANELRAQIDASPKGNEPRTPIDGCTESNCPRCRTHPDHRGDMEHAGIGRRPPQDSPKGGSEAVTDWEDGLLDGDSATLQAEHNARYEVWFAITEAHHGVWRAAFNPDTEVDHSQEVPIGTFATKPVAQRACEEHAKLARAAGGMQAQASDAEGRP